ncbi:hypothetical protein [Roseateles sp.]|uniref:hypothetical protein n=1 Tax=Roseateles sp. TaxID=1971397 RepID=UPI002F42B36B
MPDSVEDALREFRGPRSVPRLLERLQVFPASELFSKLFAFSVMRQGSEHPVAASAVALHALNPPCSLPLETAIGSLLPEWDISLEEVVWYLVKQFGVAAVISAVSTYELQSNGSEVSARLRAIRYWADIPITRS